MNPDPFLNFTRGSCTIPIAFWLAAFFFMSLTNCQGRELDTPSCVHRNLCCLLCQLLQGSSALPHMPTHLPIPTLTQDLCPCSFGAIPAFTPVLLLSLAFNTWSSIFLNTKNLVFMTLSD